MVKTKKESSLRNLRVCHDVCSYFRPRTKVRLRLRGHKQYFWGARAVKCTSGAPDLLLFLGGTILVWGAQAVFWGHGPEMFPSGARPALYIFANRIVMQLSRRVFQKISHTEILQEKCVVDFCIVDCFSAF